MSKGTDGISFPNLSKTFSTLSTSRFLGNVVGGGDGIVDVDVAITSFSLKIRAKTRKKVKMPKEDRFAFLFYL